MPANYKAISRHRQKMKLEERKKKYRNTIHFFSRNTGIPDKKSTNPVTPEECKPFPSYQGSFKADFMAPIKSRIKIWIVVNNYLFYHPDYFA